MRVVGGAEAADGAQALAEGADDEIDVGLDSLLLGEAAAVLAEAAERMGLVDQEPSAVTPLDLHEVRQRRGVAEHAVHAFDDHQPAIALAAEAGQATVEVGGIVVSEAHDGGAGSLHAS